MSHIVRYLPTEQFIYLAENSYRQTPSPPPPCYMYVIPICGMGDKRRGASATPIYSCIDTLPRNLNPLVARMALENGRRVEKATRRVTRRGWRELVGLLPLQQLKGMPDVKGGKSLSSA